MVAGSDAAERDGTPADQALATRTASVPSGSDSRSVVGPAARPAVGSTTRSIYRAASSRTDALPGADFRVAGTAPAEAGRPDSDRDGVPEARPPILVRKVDPVYPSELDDAGIGGTALLRIRVGADGLPKQVEVTRSSGHEALDQEAVAAVARFLWQPGVGATGPRDFWVDLGITFRAGT
jgi:protein TonB